jgi:hypothetical protein
VLDEKLDHRADGSLLQSESSDRVWLKRQADWKGLEVPAIGISLQDRTSNNREESSGREQFMAQVVRKGEDTLPRHRQPVGEECCREKGTKYTGLRHVNPWLVYEFRKRDLATARPGACCSGNHQVPILEKNFRMYVIMRKRLKDSSQHEVDFAVTQLPIFRRTRLNVNRMNDDLRISTRQTINNRGQESRHQRLGAADVDFPHRGVSQKLDIPNSLPQLIEYHVPAFEQCVGVYCWLDTFRGPIEETYAKSIFKGSNCVGYGRLGHGEMFGRLRHAAPLNDSRKDVELAQPNASADAIFPRLGGHNSFHL